MRSLFALVAAVALVGCGDASTTTDPVQTACATNEACVATQVCADIDPETGLGQCVDAESSACVDDDDCTDGMSCGTDGVCERTAPTWRYVAIVSTTAGPNEINDDTAPGPDIDAIEVFRDGAAHYAAEVVVARQGLGGPPPVGNAFMRTSAVLGAPDAMANTNACVISADPEPLFWSMGDSTGFIVVTFTEALVEGDELVIHELAASTCENISIQRSDTYEVYVSNLTSSLDGITESSDIGSPGWVRVGSSEARGGNLQVTLSFGTP